jgi:hypothetical protein
MIKNRHYNPYLLSRYNLFSPDLTNYINCNNSAFPRCLTFTGRFMQ